MPIVKSPMFNEDVPYKLGWIKDPPDFRDHFVDSHPLAKTYFEQLGILEAAEGSTLLPAKVDFRAQGVTPPVLNQGSLGSCTAHAGTYLVEIISKRVYGHYICPSRLFLYYNSRFLIGAVGQEGSTMRATLAAGRLFGMAPEVYWPYNPELENTTPIAPLYGIAQEFQFTNYARLDSPGSNYKTLVQRLKATLAHGYPFIGGVTVFSSFMTSEVAKTGKVPFPSINDKYVGGHALCFVGYDDNIVIKTPDKMYIPSGETKGAFIFENSWSSGWGDKGFGYLPYEFFKFYLVSDIWTLYNTEFIDVAKQFFMPMGEH